MSTELMWNSVDMEKSTAQTVQTLRSIERLYMCTKIENKLVLTLEGHTLIACAPGQLYAGRRNSK